VGGLRPRAASGTGVNAPARCLKGVGEPNDRFDFDSAPPAPPQLARSVIYELALGAFSHGAAAPPGGAPGQPAGPDRHPALPAQPRGIHPGSLWRLMPSIPRSTHRAATNYWGYSPLKAAMAPHQGYFLLLYFFFGWGTIPLEALASRCAPCHRLVTRRAWRSAGCGLQTTPAKGQPETGPTLSCEALPTPFNYQPRRSSAYQTSPRCGNHDAGQPAAGARLIHRVDCAAAGPGS